MEIEQLARKLEPLMPKEVAHWLRLRETTDAGLRKRIDEIILSTAHRRLGDVKKKILLSLPPRQRIQGSIQLGNVIYDGEKWPAGLTKGEFLQNVAIFGRSGAGKTNVSFHLLQQLVQQNVPFLFLDWKRTTRHLLPSLKRPVTVFTPARSISPFSFNPFLAPPGLENNIYVNLLVDVLGDAYTLGDGAKSLVQKVILICHEKKQTPTISAVLSTLEQIPTTDRAKGWQLSAMRALESLQFATGSIEGEKQANFVQSLAKTNVIVELDGLSDSAKQFLVSMLCLWLYYCRLTDNRREELQHVIFVEEAHHFLYRQEGRSRESVMNMLLRQCREIGIGMVVVDQHPHLISSAALGNTFTTICMNLKEPSDINKSAGLCMLDDGDKQAFNMLPVGHGIVKLQDRWRRPFLVRFPQVDVRKGSVTDGLLRQYLTGSGPNPLKALKNEQVQRIQLDDTPLGEGELMFLEDVIAFPNDGVKSRYQRLGNSVGRGNGIKSRLTALGWLESETIDLGTSRKVLLRLTGEGRKALGFEKPESARRESLAHEYWKNFYARQFQAQGFDVQLEAPRHKGFVDFLAAKDGKLIGVEIETGKSNVLNNIRNGLWSGYYRVFVIATNRETMKTIERLIAAAHLLIPNRVEIHSAGTWTVSHNIAA